MIDPSDITGMVLSGGQGRRMGGVDKGLELFLGVPLALHALRRLQPQVGASAINANRHIAHYQTFGVPVWSDAALRDGLSENLAAPPDAAPYPGPLAGLHAGLSRCTTRWLVTVPCDTPWFPQDLVAQLCTAVHISGADLAIACAPDAMSDAAAAHPAIVRPQPVFCLLRRSLLTHLTAFLQAGGRKVGAWTQQQHGAHARFEGSRAARAFGNANTAEDLALLERWGPQNNSEGDGTTRGAS